MDPVVDPRSVSPFSVRGIARGVGSLYNGAVDATSQGIEAVAKPFSRPVGYTPAVAAPPAPVVVAPPAVAPAAVAPAVSAATPVIGTAVNAIQQRQQLLDSLKDGGVVGRDGKHKPARGARRAMPGRGGDARPAAGFAPSPDAGTAPVRGFADGGQVDQDPQGLVQGPGTGTSDSVPAEVPTGTYVMPQDSTQEVNLSNGEFKVAPETVMAMGTAALDALRAATHTPVGEGGAPDVDPAAVADDTPGFKNGGKVCPPGAAKGARRGYANGGQVDDGRGNVTYGQPAGGRTLAPQPGANEYVSRNSGPTDATGNSFELENASTAGAGRGKVNPAPARGARRGFKNGGSTLVDQIPTDGLVAPTGGQRIANDPIASSELARNVVNTISAVSPQAGGAAGRAATSILRGGVAAAGSPTMAAVAPYVPIAGGAAALQAGSAPAAAPAAPAPVQAPQAARPAPMAAAAAVPAPAAVAPTAATAAPGAQAAPAADAVAPQNTSADNIATMGRAGQIYREIAAMQNAGGNQPGSVMPDHAAEHNAQFDREMMIQRAARMGGRGAAAMLGLVGVGDRAAADVQGAQIHEAGANTRATTQESGATARENARLASTEGVENRRLEAGKPEQQIRVGVGRQQLAEGDRMAKLRAKLDTTTDPNQRRQLQDQILAESGKAPPPNRFTVVPGGSGVDPQTGQVVREQSQVLDNQSGQFVHQGQGSTAAARVTPRADYDKMPAGARYIGPDGKPYIKG
jgi:hypothetical protein